MSADRCFWIFCPHASNDLGQSFKLISREIVFTASVLTEAANHTDAYRFMIEPRNVRANLVKRPSVLDFTVPAYDDVIADSRPAIAAPIYLPAIDPDKFRRRGVPGCQFLQANIAPGPRRAAMDYDVIGFISAHEQSFQGFSR